MPRRCCPQVPGTPVLLLLYTVYLLLGAGVFWALESQGEAGTAQHLQELLKSHNFTCLDNQTLRRFIQGVIEAYKHGITLDENTTTMGKWKYEGAFFFSVSAITTIALYLFYTGQRKNETGEREAKIWLLIMRVTIGYGNLSPDTVGGRIFCIFFALFGIPLNLILLHRIGQWMLQWVHRCGDLLGRKLSQQRMAKALTSSCALLIGLLLFFLLPPLMFCSIEGWTYDEAVYYAFITLSTIGFGDYVIGMNPSRVYPSWYKNVTALWILFGMAWLALVINLCISLCESHPGDICQCSKESTSKELEQELMDVTHNSSLVPVVHDSDDSGSCCSKERTSKELEQELMDVTHNGNLVPVAQDSDNSGSCSSKESKSENPD